MTNPAHPHKPATPSDHLANERTFLAWIRTSISIIVFGFVVAKFGITLREFLALQNRAVEQSGIALGIGVGFMVMGIFMALTAMVRYQMTMRRIEANTFKPTHGV